MGFGRCRRAQRIQCIDRSPLQVSEFPSRQTWLVASSLDTARKVFGVLTEAVNDVLYHSASFLNFLTDIGQHLLARLLFSFVEHLLMRIDLGARLLQLFSNHCERGPFGAESFHFLLDLREMVSELRLSLAATCPRVINDGSC